MRRSWVMAVCAAGLLAPGSAVAAGGPVPPVQGGQGVSIAGQPVRYVAVNKDGNTRVKRVRSADGAIELARLIDGRYGVPGVAYDGSTTGLSADGNTLVLARITKTYPPKSTRLLVVDTQTLAVRKRITLPGFIAVDAISPDGSTLYTLRYRGAGFVKYEVLPLDVASGQLGRTPIMDPREPDEKMGGVPLARTMSPDGRWAYTLYTGEENFVHALDTLKGQARCIDLPAGDPSAAHLRLDGETLHVGNFATVDLQTFALANAKTAPTATPTRTPTPTPAAQKSAGFPWAPFAVAIVALTVVGVLVGRRKRRGDALPSTA